MRGRRSAISAGNCPTVRDGYTCLAVAENKLMWDFLDRKANAVRGVEAAAFGYAEHWGAAPFRETISRFGSAALWHEPVDPETIVTMAGAGATLEATFASLCNPGEGVLIPTPSYAAYWLDIETRIGLHGIPVPASADDAFRLHVSDLEAAFRTSPVPISPNSRRPSTPGCWRGRPTAVSRAGGPSILPKPRRCERPSP